MQNGDARKVIASNDRKDSAVPAQHVVRQMHIELLDLFEQRQVLMRRIGTIKRSIIGLAALFGDDVLSNEVRELVDGAKQKRKFGLTKACRMVLMEAGHALHLREVHDRVQETTPAILAGHKVPMASVRTILDRLVDHGEAQRIVLGNGRRAWQWAAEPGSQSVSADSAPDQPLG
jgi:hypothetical protein